MLSNCEGRNIPKKPAQTWRVGRVDGKFLRAPTNGWWSVQKVSFEDFNMSDWQFLMPHSNGKASPSIGMYWASASRKLRATKISSG